MLSLKYFRKWHALRSGVQTGLCLAIIVFPLPSWSKEGDVRMDVAMQLAEKGEFDRAVQELRQYLSEHPEATDIYTRIGDLRFKQGNFRLAGENYKVALKKNPNLSDARQGLALAYEKTGERKKAAEEWQKLSDSVKNPEVRKMAMAHLIAIQNGKEAPSQQRLPVIPTSTKGQLKEDHAKPADAFQEAPYSPALDSSALTAEEGIYAQVEFQEALRSYRAHKLDSALIWLRKSLSKSPDHAGAFYLGGVIRFERGEYSKSMYNLKRGLEYPKRGFNGHYYLGRIYQRQDRQAEAIKAYERYVALTKSVPGKKLVESFLMQMAASKTNLKPGQDSPQEPTQEPTQNFKEHSEKSQNNGENNEKTPELSPLPVLFGQDGPLFFLIPDRGIPSGQKLIEAYEVCRKEKYEKAENILKETALAYGGSDNAEAAVLNMASVYLQLGLWDLAESRLQDYLSFDSTDSRKYIDAAHYLLGLAELGNKKGDKAEKSLLQVKAGVLFGPTQEEIDYRLSQAGELLQDSKKWSAYLERAYSSAKPSLRRATLAQKLGLLHSKYGSSDRAMEYYRKSLQEGADTSKSVKASIPTLLAVCAESQLRLADLTFKKKDWKGAKARYQEFVSKYSDHKELAWVHYQIANTYMETHNFESALNEYKRVIDNYPDSYWASQAKWKREDTIWQKEYEEVLD